MPTTKKLMTLTEIFKIVKENFADSDLTIKEVALNSDVSEELVAIFLDDRNNIVNDLSRLIQFSNTSFRLKKAKLIKFKVSEYGKQILHVKRIIKPKCTVNFNAETGELTNFRTKIEINDIDKQLLINEFYEFMKKYKK